MATVSKALLASLILIILSLFILNTIVLAAPTTHTVNSYGSGGKLSCGVKCAARCSVASRKKICLRACGACCARCQCVPPGTSGNEDACPCYATMTTHGGHFKCP